MTEDNDNIPSPDDPTLDPQEISPAPSIDSTNDPLIGTKIGSCTLKRIIGSGGMGTVYEAVQEKPRRRVALKMMKRGIASRSALRRFEFESQTLARLKHQGIAQVYEAGTHDDGSGGVPYFVMELVPNKKSITDFAADKKLGTKERLALFAKVCDAVQHGHLKGIVHRDLKPGNILVDSSGQPKIIDFGVARSTDSDMAVTTLQTDVGQLIGTLQYMSPEQCEADPNDIDIRSDVYALGVIMYELITGKPPYDIKQVAIHEAVRIVREEEPTKLSTIDRHLRGDIETIALKALEKERARRYQSACSLQEDVQHYLNDEPITATPPGALDYIRRFARKYRAAAVAISAVVVVLVVAVIGISIFAIEAQVQRKSAVKAQIYAVEQQQIAEDGKQSALRQAYYGNIQAASAIKREEMSSAHLRRAHDRLAAAKNALENINTDYLPFELQYLNAQFDDSLYIMPAETQNSGGDLSKSISFNPDGSLLASCFCGSASVLRIRETSTGIDVIDPLPLPSRWGCGLTFNPDGSLLAFSDGLNAIRLFETSTGKEVAKPIEIKNASDTFAFSPNGAHLATKTGDTIQIWSTATGEKVIGPISGHEGMIMSLDFSPDGALLATAGHHDKTVRIWDATNGKELATLKGHGLAVDSAIFSPDGNKIVSRGDDGYRVWDIATKQQIVLLDKGAIIPNSMAFSSDGSRLATGPSPLRIYDTNSWELIAEEHPGIMTNYDLIALNFNGSKLVKTQSTKIEIYNVRPKSAKAGDYFDYRAYGFTDAEAVDLEKQWKETGTLNQKAFDRLQAVGIHRKYVENALASLEKEDLVQTVSLNGHSDRIDALIYTPDGGQLATASTDGTIRIWDIEGNYELGKDATAAKNYTRENWPRALLAGATSDPIQNPSVLRSSVFSPDGSQIAAVFQSHFARGTTSRHRNNGLEWTQTPRSASPTIKLLDAKTGSELAVLAGHELDITSIAFSGENDSLLASGSTDHTVRIWDTRTGKQLMTLFHSRPVSDVAFNNDGTLLVSCDSETAKIWATSTGEEIAVIQTPKDPRYPQFDPGFWSVSFTPDGHLLFITTLAGLHVWNTQENAWEDTQQFLSLKNRPTHTVVCQSTGRIARYERHGANLYLYPSWRESSTGSRKIPKPSSMAFTKDGTRLVTGSSDGIISIRDSNSGEEILGILPTHTAKTSISSVSISPDSSTIAAVVRSGGGSVPLNLLGLKKYTTQSLGQRVVDRRMHSQRISRLTPLVEDWMGKNGGDYETVLALLEHQCKNADPDDVATLTNLVLAALGPTTNEWNMQQRIKLYQKIAKSVQEWNKLERDDPSSGPMPSSGMHLQNLIRHAAFSDSTFFDATSDTTLTLAKHYEKQVIEEWGWGLMDSPSVIDVVLFRQGKFNELKRRWETIATYDGTNHYQMPPEEVDYLKLISDRLSGLVDSPDELESGIFSIISDEALQFAKRACELTDYKDTTCLSTLARVHFRRSEIDDAIYWQEETVKLHEANSNALGKSASDHDIAALRRYQSEKNASTKP